MRPGGAAGVEYAPMMRLLYVAACLSIALSASAPAQSPRSADARNMALVGHNDLNGGGDGGEGLALHMWPDGRRILYLAHEAPERCLSILDVTRPEAPALLNQLRSPAPGVTHHVEDVVRQVERVVLMRDAGIVADGPKRQLLTAQRLSELFGVGFEVEERGGEYRLW